MIAANGHTVVAATAIGAMAGLIGGLGGPVITARIQRSNERSRQRERAAEVLGSAGLLLTELNPGSVLVPIYVAPVLQSSEQDAIGEALAKLAKLDQRVPVVRENLATLAGGGPPPRDRTWQSSYRRRSSNSAAWTGC